MVISNSSRTISQKRGSKPGMAMTTASTASPIFLAASWPFTGTPFQQRYFRFLLQTM
jgi:hypothetical protein